VAASSVEGFIMKNTLLYASAVTAVLMVTACGKKSEEKPPQTGMEQSTPEMTAQAHTATDSPMVSQESGTGQTLQPPIKQTPERFDIVIDPSGRYAIQLSAWKTRTKAETEARKLRDRGIEVYIQKAKIPEKGGTWYRLRVGNFYSKEDALTFVRTRLSPVLEDSVWIDWARK